MSQSIYNKKNIYFIFTDIFADWDYKGMQIFAFCIDKENKKVSTREYYFKLNTLMSSQI